MSFVAGQVRVSVPATSANLGPGFDALGLALDLRDELTVEVADRLEITVDGADQVPLDESHLVYRSMVRAFEAMGVEAPGVRLHCVNVIPHGRGLGSSSAAIVGGVAAARGLVTDGAERLDDDALFALAAEIEGHPDNVAPAVFGGFTIAYAEGGAFRAVRREVDPRIVAVAFVPSAPVETKVARGLLPATVPHAEAAANGGRAALLVAALTDSPALLLDATRDWLHQEQRRPAMPESAALVARLRSEGHAAVISGAGPTVLVLGVEAESERVVAHAPDGWRVLRPALDATGVHLL